MQFHDGPLAGIKGVQSTIGDYTVDDAEPSKQKVHNKVKTILTAHLPMKHAKHCMSAACLY